MSENQLTKPTIPLGAERGCLENYPYPYPSGWYRLLDSAQLKPGDLRYMECLGLELVVWRSKSGKAHVMHSFCPHLGANLSGGCVVGELIECPFHGWQFFGDGHVARVPYSEQIPRGALVKTYPQQEVHGQLFMFHDCLSAERTGDEVPPYPVPRIADVDEDRFVYRGAHDAGRFQMHLIEFAEISANKTQLPRAHGEMHVPWTQLKVPGFKIDDKTDWSVDFEAEGNMHFVNQFVPCVQGREIKTASVRALISFYGPGSLVKHRFTVPNRGRIEMYQTHLPIGPFEQQVNFRWFADRKLPQWLVWYIIGSWISRWTRDISNWKENAERTSANLARSDELVTRLLEWYQQYLPNALSTQSHTMTR